MGFHIDSRPQNEGQDRVSQSTDSPFRASRSRRVLLPTLLLAIMCLTGCRSKLVYVDYSSGYLNAFQEGRLDEASSAVNEVARWNAGSNSGLLYSLERGAVLRAADRTVESQQAFETAEAMIVDFCGPQSL